MKTIVPIIHWLSYAYYVYVFGYASLFKVFQKQSMMQSMQSLGFNKTWTIIIGIGELIGVLLVLIGFFKPHLKNFGILLLFPFAVGAFTAHMAHQEYQHFYNSLLMCILTFILLATDKNFKITL
ncbi:DoxX family protein [Flavobacterium microcysteis]|uniref:DoxX family protein n=1 Tax=Flavobacterium microcysteis TaxID=2596891 RepID=A0A501QLJ4_9FLAO|nr:DoxX family protein [Flavobacterium microcysteis]TPD73392.1 DoxX family protein [Flavobacterium microcysteis]